ncbi:MAG: restriction endonuclease [Promethearchaeota archaeon]
MLSYPDFIILGNNTKEKGDNFEIFLKDYLSSQGYSNIQSERKTGMQIDFTAIDIFSKIHIFGEAKGYSKDVKVKNNDVFAFRSKFEQYKEKKENKDLKVVKPIFVTTSEFTWEIEETIKNGEFMGEIELIDGRKLIDRLRESSYIPLKDLLNEKIKNNIPFERGDLHIILYNGKFFWLQEFKINESTYFSIFEKDGDILKHNFSSQIIELLPDEFKEFNYIDLDVKYKILKYLFRRDYSTIDDLSSDLEITKEAIKINIEFLNKYEKIIRLAPNKGYFLSKEYEWFRSLFNLIFKAENQTQLLGILFTSEYFEKAMSETMITRILNRFYINNLGKKETHEFSKIVKLFPSVLNYCLNEHDQLRMFEKYPEDSAEKKYKFLKFHIFSLITEDLFKNNELMKTIFTNKQIFDERIIGKITLLKEKKLYLSFDAEAKLSYMKYVGDEDIEPGTPIKLVDKRGMINIINSYIELEDFQGAIYLCDIVLNDPDLEEVKYAALINKGFCLANIGQLVDSIKIYEEALQQNRELPLIYRNLFHAWMGKYYAAINHQKEFPLNINNLFNYLINARECYKKLKSEVEENNEYAEIMNTIKQELEREFNSFYKQSLSNLNDIQIINLLNYIRELDDAHIKPIYNVHKERIKNLVDLEYFRFLPISWNYLAYILLLIGEYDLALTAINKALKFLDEKPNKYVYLDTKAEILHKKNINEEAFQIFSEILKIDKDDFRIKPFYAETCWKAAKTAKVLGYEDKFIELLKKSCAHNNDTYCAKKIKKDCLKNKNLLNCFNN